MFSYISPYEKILLSIYEKSFREVEMDKHRTFTGFPRQEDKYILLCTIISTKNILSTSMVLLTQQLGYSYFLCLSFSNAPDGLGHTLLHKDEKINLD